MTKAKKQELMKLMQLAIYNVGVEEFIDMTAEVFKRLAEDESDNPASQEHYLLYAEYLRILNESDDETLEENTEQ